MRTARPWSIIGLLSVSLLVFLFAGCSSTSSRQPAYYSVSSYIESHEDDFQECFNDTSIPESIGRVRMKVRFWLDAKGSVTRSIVTESAVKYPLLDECVLSVIRSIHFDPSSNDSTEITYPLLISRK